MTKTSIFGQPEVKQDEKKPIEFVKSYLDGDCWIESEELTAGRLPINWENIVLLELGYNSDGLDLMWAYDDNPNKGMIFLGNWNDGIV